MAAYYSGSFWTRVGLTLSEKSESLDELRRRIEAVTLEIFSLSGERLHLAKQIGRIKARRGIPVENAEVEQKLTEKVMERCRKKGLDEDFCLMLLQVLLEESKRVQSESAKTQS
jgi:chorismate mutase